MPFEEGTEAGELEDGVDAAGMAMPMLKVPALPCAAEVAQHNISHLPHREWCRHCVAGRGKQDRHYKVASEGSIPTCSLDYLFLGDGEGGAPPILVFKDHRSKWVESSVVKRKGEDPYAIKILAEWLEATGYPRLTLKSDGEPAIKSLKRAAMVRVREQSAVEILMEESPVEDHQKNG
eukprot:6472952-Amphidinium_carterae.2